MGVTIENYIPNLRTARKAIAFDGGTGSGANGSVALFDVTGEVLIALMVPFCTESLVSGGGGDLALGLTGQTALLIAATTATDIDVSEFWTDATPTDVGGVALPSALKDILASANIIGTVANGAISDGTIEFTVYWMPISTDGLVVAA